MAKGRAGAASSMVLLMLGAAGAHARAADTQQTQNVWTTWSSSMRLHDAWGLSADLTLRSTDDWNDLRSIEFRPGITYAWSPRLSLAGGFSIVRNNDAGPDTTEKRLWAQFATPMSLGRARITHRVRLEERFIERIGKPDVTATRVRYQVKAQIPFATPAGQPFTHGGYALLQEETMVHVAGAAELNGHAFDQQRLYAGVGRRFTPAMDLELSYLHQFVSGRTTDTRGHIVQVTWTTRF